MIPVAFAVVLARSPFGQRFSGHQTQQLLLFLLPFPVIRLHFFDLFIKERELNQKRSNTAKQCDTEQILPHQPLILKYY